MTITAAIQTIGWLMGSAVLAAGEPAPASAPVGAAPVQVVAAVQPVAATCAVVNRSQVEAAGLSVYWQRSVPLARGEQVVRMHRIEENLYLITNVDRVLTLDAATGGDRWSATVGQQDIRVLGPTHGPEMVYFATVLNIQAFDRVDGDRKLQWKDEIKPASAIASDGQDLYFGTIEGRVVSVRQRDMLLSWQFATDGMVTATPILLGRNILVVSQTGQVTAAEKSNKTRVWQTNTTGPVRAAPTVRGSHLYVASMDQSLWCFDVVTGQTVWRRRMSWPLQNAPCATAKHVYLPVGEHGLFSLSSEDGKVEWCCQDGANFLMENGDLAWLSSERSSLLGCDRATGEVRREIASSAEIFISNENDDAIWMATCDGHLVCLRPQGAGFLRYRTAREAMGRTALPTTHPASRPADQGLVPEPRPKPPTDYLRRSDVIPPVGGNAPATQPSGEK